MHIYVRRGGPNYQSGLAKMRKLGAELGVPIEVRIYEPSKNATQSLMMCTVLCHENILAQNAVICFVVGSCESPSK